MKPAQQHVVLTLLNTVVIAILLLLFLSLNADVETNVANDSGAVDSLRRELEIQRYQDEWSRQLSEGWENDVR